ncbi:lamin tail domain-containing protein [Candidatus Saccharibacteria bacterium]|nr:lamin tail domain-containing protein [Candidatus Saccharibacteria bacterium]
MKIQRVVPVLFFILCVFGQSIFTSVKNASAISENLVIYQTQTAGAVSGTASQELVLLYNNGPQDVNITDWCIKYSSSTDSSGFSKCITPPDALTEIWLSSGGIVSFASAEFVAVNAGFTPDFLFSAGMAATAGHLRIMDNNNAEVDKVGWGSAISPETTTVPAHATGSVLSRSLNALVLDTDNNLNDFSSKPAHSPIISGLFEVEIQIDICPNIDGLQLVIPNGYLTDDNDDCYFDVCPNLDELQIELGTQYYIDLLGDCQLIPLENRVLFITEILPNAVSTDTGQEYIEIYNPHNETIDLTGYKLQVGPSYTEEFEFVNGTIAPGQYAVFSDTTTGIILPNTTGVKLRLNSPAGNVVSESAVYSNADDDVTWALIEDTWAYTNQITRGSANKPYLEPAQDEVAGVTSVLAPCPIGKYRNPETNRCRTIETAVSQLSACDEDEFRSPDTNRCRKVSSSSSLASCDPGEERNPDTNRCRKTAVLGVSSQSDLPEIQDVAVENVEGQINWQIITLAVGITGVYMIYEWRNEIRHKIYFSRSSIR